MINSKSRSKFDFDLKLEFPLMDVHSQGHHGAADVEVVGEGEDGHEELPNLKRAVVEQLHRLLSQVAYKQ